MWNLGRVPVVHGIVPRIVEDEIDFGAANDVVLPLPQDEEGRSLHQRRIASDTDDEISKPSDTGKTLGLSGGHSGATGRIVAERRGENRGE